jgi:hypothetical protein
MVVPVVVAVTMHQLPELHRVPIRLPVVQGMETNLLQVVVVAVQLRLALQVL